jgi:heptosyltransferase-1
LEYYFELGRLLKESTGMPLVLNGPASDAALLESVPGVVPHVSGIEGLIYATRRALAVVGIDSGPMHLAAALSKPGVAIFGPTDPRRNGPYGGTIAVLRHADARTTYKRRNEIDRSMSAIRPEQVMHALRERMDSYAATERCSA